MVPFSGGVCSMPPDHAISIGEERRRPFKGFLVMMMIVVIELGRMKGGYCYGACIEAPPKRTTPWGSGGSLTVFDFGFNSGGESRPIFFLSPPSIYSDLTWADSIKLCRNEVKKRSRNEMI